MSSILQNEYFKLYLIVGIILTPFISFLVIGAYDQSVRHNHYIDEVIRDVKGTACDRLMGDYHVREYYLHEQGTIMKQDQRVYDTVLQKLVECNLVE